MNQKIRLDVIVEVETEIACDAAIDKITIAVNKLLGEGRQSLTSYSHFPVNFTHTFCTAENRKESLTRAITINRE